MRIFLALTRYSTLLLILLFYSHSAEAKKPNRKTKPAKVKTTFTTDWSNVDSLEFYYQQRRSTGDFVTALRIGDSLIKHPSMQSKVNELTRKKITLLDSLGKKSEVLVTLKRWQIELIASDSLLSYATWLSDVFASSGDYKSAFELEKTIAISQQTEIKDLENSLDSLQKNSVNEKAKSENALQTAKSQAQSTRFYLWIVSALAFILTIVTGIFITKQFRMRKQHEKLGAQMDHTRIQIDKAFEEGDRINLEIRSMKEQVSRIEAEKKQLRQNIVDSTTETLPLLRQQLDALAKENTGALPVEKYMAIQNTITRLNKQLRDIS